MLSLKRREKTTSSSDDNKIDHRYVVYIFFFGSTLFLIQFRYFVWQNQLITCPCADASWSFFPCIFTETQKKNLFFSFNRIKFANGTAFGREFLFKWMNLDEPCVRAGEQTSEWKSKCLTRQCHAWALILWIEIKNTFITWNVCRFINRNRNREKNTHNAKKVKQQPAAAVEKKTIYVKKKCALVRMQQT